MRTMHEDAQLIHVIMPNTKGQHEGAPAEGSTIEKEGEQDSYVETSEKNGPAKVEFHRKGKRRKTRQGRLEAGW